MKEQQLTSKSLDELLVLKQDLSTRKQELEEKKARKDDWSDENQSELEEIVLQIVDIDEAIETKELDGSKKYEPAKGSETSIHLMVCKNVRYNQVTGKRIANEFIQIFSYSEWRAFKKHFKSLGYCIIKVLYDPYNEAQKFVENV